MMRLRLALCLALAAPSAAAHGQPVDQSQWNAQKRHVTLPNGLAVAYLELGDPKGKPLLLLHGYTDSSRTWSLLVPHLSRHRLIIPDQRGHGATAAPVCCYGTTQMVGSSRVDLQACKLEYSIVSPK